MGIVIGVDIGQKRDPTAICVAELQNRDLGTGDEGERSLTHYVARHLERLPLGTLYPVVAKRVKTVIAGAFERTGETSEVFVDTTGVGAPIVDLLEELEPPAKIIPVYFTYGDRRREEGSQVMLGKAYLVSRLQSLLQSRRLHLPASPEAEALKDELLNYEIRVDENANDRYGAFRVGTHDDLVTALGLAVQTEPREYLGWRRRARINVLNQGGIGSVAW